MIYEYETEDYVVTYNLNLILQVSVAANDNEVKLTTANADSIYLTFDSKERARLEYNKIVGKMKG